MSAACKRLVPAAACAATMFLFSCGGGGQAPAPATSGSGTATSSAPAAIDPATAASISGKVTFEGTPPSPQPIKLTSDPFCASANPGLTTEAGLVGPGGVVQNVFVYVKDGLGSFSYDPPTDMPKIDQRECRYHPHVFGMRVGQPLEIMNSDPTLHNIHAIPKTNSEFNNGQPIQGMKMTHTFDKPEVMVPFKCDVHGWMNAYVGVLDHPYFAVTDATGSFDIKNLPPGTYTIEAWHEKLGTMQQKVTIGAKETKDAPFTFKAAATTATSD